MKQARTGRQMAFTKTNSSSKQGSPIAGMLILVAAYFFLTHPGMLGIKGLGNNNSAAKATEITEQAAATKADQDNQGGILHGAANRAKAAAATAVANPLNNTGATALHKITGNVDGNVSGTTATDQITTYSGTKDDAKRYVRPATVNADAAKDYYSESTDKEFNAAQKQLVAAKLAF